MKKVLFVATVTSHIKTFHIPYLELLKKNGYEIHIASKGNQAVEYCDKHFEMPFERFPIKSNNIKVYKELKKIIDENEYEIIHCHTPVGGVIARLAAKKARKNGTRVIYTAHGFHFYKGASLKNWLFFYPIEWYLAKYTDTLITINNDDFEIAKKKFSKRCKDIQYVPGVGIDTTKFNIEMNEEEKRKLRESLGLKNEDFVLTCIARLDRNKNQSFLINCMQELVKENDNIHLLLAGTDELNGYYQKIVKEKALNNNVHFLGKRKDVPQLLCITDIVVSASKREGLPVNVIEAMCVGIPVVALECRGMRDLIKDGENGYLFGFNESRKINEEILNLIEKKKIYGKLFVNNKSYIKKYTINNIKEIMKKIYF